MGSFLHLLQFDKKEVTNTSTLFIHGGFAVLNYVHSFNF